MTSSFTLRSLGQCRHHWNLAAGWSVTAWAGVFPNDTAQTYLDQYAQVERSTSGIPDVVAAISPTDELLGIATFVLDDELPGAIEHGPWLAAVFVAPHARGMGVGRAITMWVTARAQMLGFEAIHLYTEDKREWYENLGWRYSRSSEINGLSVDVMTLRLSTEMQSIYHLATRQAWNSRRGDYSNPSLASEGFIHCSSLHQLTTVANEYYRDTDELLVLVIDPARLIAPVHWEPPHHPEGSPADVVHLLYPHIFGPINSEAVIDVVEMSRDSNNRIRLPPRLIQR